MKLWFPILLLAISFQVHAQFSNYVKPKNQFIEFKSLDSLEQDLDSHAIYPDGEIGLSQIVNDLLMDISKEIRNEVDGNIQLWFEVGSTKGKAMKIKRHGEIWKNQPSGFVVSCIQIMNALQEWEPALKDGANVTSSYVITIGPEDRKQTIEEAEKALGDDRTIEIVMGSMALDADPNDERVYLKDAVPPSHPNGEHGLNKFLYEEIIAPIKAKNPNYSKTIIVGFVVRKDGSLTDIHTTWNRGTEEANFAQKVVETKMPMWIPAVKSGYPVHSKYYLQIKIKTVYTPEMIAEMVNIK